MDGTPGETMSDRVRTALVLAGLLSWPLAVSTPASAAETCDGQAATIVGTESDDTLEGTDGPDVVVALGGNDKLLGLGGADVLCGGEGRDVLDGGTGDDRMFGELDGIVPGRGMEDLTDGDVLLAGPGDDHLDGGLDQRAPVYQRDLLDFRQQGPTVLDLLEGTATGAGADTVAPGRYRVLGSKYDDVLRGSDHRDILHALGGDDLVVGRAGPDILTGESRGSGGGHDVVLGGRGRDDLRAYAGPDVLEGGEGADKIQDRGRTGADRIAGGDGDDYVLDFLVDAAKQTVDGGDGDDQVTLATGFGGAHPPGSLDAAEGIARIRWQDRRIAVAVTSFSWTRLPTGAWRFYGTPGDDTVHGTTGPVRLHGRGGDDALHGTDRDDLLDGGPGQDGAEPVAGHDTCVSVERVWGPSGSDCDIER